MEEAFIIAHMNQDGKTQTLKQHSEETAYLCAAFLFHVGFSDAGKLCGLLHDMAKSKKAFQVYIRGDEKLKIDHSTGGGLYINKCMNVFLADNKSVKAKITAQLIAQAIFCHHSKLKNILSYTGEFEYKKRLLSDKNKIDYDESVINYTKCCVSAATIEALFSSAVLEMTEVLQHIQAYTKVRSEIDFALGMLQRLVYSSLCDADKYNTYGFSTHTVCEYETDRNTIWETLKERLETYLDNLPSDSDINIARCNISNACKVAATGESGIYRLLAPTGSGKTMASLRFALHHAIKNKKIRHLYYVIPYLSILTQNAKTLRDTLQEEDEELILEHYSDLIFERDEEEKNHKFLTERADNAIIITSYVQLLNTLFDGSKQSARRMHQLTDSIIIFDEIQSLPLCCTSLFNSAMKFLVNICNCSVVLCSATQPVLSMKGPIQRPIDIKADILQESEYYAEKFRRTKIIDKTANAMGIQEIATFAIDKLQVIESELFVMNTKKEVFELYKQIKNQVDADVKVFYLSTNLCPAHKAKVIHDIYKTLYAISNDHYLKVICISTPLIEAGVDLDFQMVVRACSGLDNILQAAGRCNRNGLQNIGYVYIIEVENENLNSLKETEVRKTCTMIVLNNIRKKPTAYQNGDILSSTALHEYYCYYFEKLKEIQDYPYYDDGRKGDLYDLLTANKHGMSAYEEIGDIADLSDYPLRQAFHDAGRIFQVIDEKTTAVLVEYDAGKQIISSLLRKDIDDSARVSLLKHAQRYSINLYDNQIRLLGNAILKDHDLGIWILQAKNYNEEYGLDIDGEAEMYMF